LIINLKVLQDTPHTYMCIWFWISRSCI